ncbi:MAG TPA: agmatinase family protein [Flavipsychrobacter sp.]|jgi:agmatinase|nr:agmatinase family protein [Flavipsychrobacter sp.]
MAVDLSGFDPNSVGLKSNNIFGLPFKESDAELILLPVPWEVTISYRDGTSRGPENIFEASMQVDLYDPDTPDAWKKGFYMLPVDKNIKKKSDYLRQCAELIISHLIEGGLVDDNEQLAEKLEEVNDGGILLYNWVHEMTSTFLKAGKKVALIGGDHSTPLGFIKALSEMHPEFGVLQIDAHADLRKAYEGFTYSHASIMYNILNEIPEVKKLVQVGIRDYCDEEVEMMQANPDRISTWFDKTIKEKIFEGDTWKKICEEIVAQLPQKVYISFDIDGLDPKLCPNTGTPVPGGFELDAVFYLFKTLKNSGREIIGFDLNEVSTGQYGVDGIDSIVGARALYKLCNYLVA